MQTYPIAVQWLQEKETLPRPDQLEKSGPKEIAAITGLKPSSKCGRLRMQAVGWYSVEMDDLRRNEIADLFLGKKIDLKYLECCCSSSYITPLPFGLDEFVYR